MSNKTKCSDEEEIPKMECVCNAMKCEQTGHIMEAILLYEEAIFKLSKMYNSDQRNQQMYRKYLTQYEEKAKKLRDRVKCHLQSSKLVDRICIERDVRGRSYQRLFGPYMNDSVKEAHVNEPNLTETHQFQNLINFLEVLVKNCRFLKYIRLTTRPDPLMCKNQYHILQKIRTDLATGNIHMNFQLDETLHDRKIVLSSGIVIKIGRGLHYFEPCEDVYQLGLCDYDFRKCLATEVDIWKSRAFAKPPKKQESNVCPAKRKNNACQEETDCSTD